MKIGTTVLGATMLALASLAASAADNVSYSYIDLNYVNTDLERGPSGDEFALNVAGRYFFSTNFAVGAEYEIGDDAQNFIIGIRFTF